MNIIDDWFELIQLAKELGECHPEKWVGKDGIFRPPKSEYSIKGD